MARIEKSSHTDKPWISEFSKSKYTETEEVGSEDNNIWNKIRPLYMRGANGLQIAKIADLGLNQVLGIIDGVSKSRTAPIREAVFNRRKIQSFSDLSYEPSLDEEKSVKFARELLRVKWIGNNISCWRQYIKFCQDNNIEIPESFYKQVRGEIFFGAKLLAIMGDEENLTSYKDMGNSVDREWFSKSLRIEEALFGGKLQVEAQKYFNNARVPLGLDDRGCVVYDSSQEIIKRTKSRWGWEIADQFQQQVSPNEGRHFGGERH